MGMKSALARELFTSNLGILSHGTRPSIPAGGGWRRPFEMQIAKCGVFDQRNVPLSKDSQ